MILQAFIRGALVIAIAALIATLLRHRSAAIRHHVWATAVVVQLALLAFIPVLPKIHLPVIPTIHAEIDLPAQTVESTNPAAVTSTVNDAAPETGNVGEPLDSSGFSLPRNPMAWITLIWLAGGALILARYIIGTLMMMRIAVRGERVEDGDWLVLALRTARELGITRPITMIWGDKVAVPITWGVLYPMILLPKNAQGWSQERRRFVLVHEMAHVKRFDAFTQLLAQITTAVFWFSPFVWLAEWRMRVEREHACDDTVLRHGTEPAKYADELLQMVRTLVRRRTPQPAFAALAMARKSEFEGRMLAILDPERPRRVTGITSGVVFAMLSVLIAAPLAAVDPFAVRVVTMPTTASPRVPVPSAPVVIAPDCNFASSGGATTAEVHENGLQVRLKRGARCSFVDVSGPVRISPDERRILAVDEGGQVRVRESTPGRTMQLFIERTSVGGVKRDFTINGRVPDDDGRTEREWLARVLPELLTEGSINPQQRVMRMLKSNGLAGTLRQIAAITSPTARALHFKELVVIDDWSPAEVDRIRTAAVESLKSSPSDLASFNRAVPVRARANAAQTNPASLSDVELIDKILTGITSGHDLSVAMLAQAPNANGDILIVFARHAERMSSDYEKRSFLIAAGPQYLSKDRAVVGSWFNAASKIGSSFDRRLALTWAISQAKDDPQTTLALIRATHTMSSGTDKAAVLVAMARAKLLTTNESRTAFLNEVSTLSSSYDRRTVLEAL